MIYWKFKNLIYVSLTNPFKTMKKLKGIFKPLQCYFMKGKDLAFEWNPFIWIPSPSKIQIIARDIGWKDKWDTPRFEEPPFIWIHLFRYDFIWFWSLAPHLPFEDTNYWEQALWYLYYYRTYSQKLSDSPDINIAKESWPWTSEGKSTWNDKYLINGN